LCTPARQKAQHASNSRDLGTPIPVRPYLLPKDTAKMAAALEVRGLQAQIAWLSEELAASQASTALDGAYKRTGCRRARRARQQHTLTPNRAAAITIMIGLALEQEWHQHRAVVLDKARQAKLSWEQYADPWAAPSARPG